MTDHLSTNFGRRSFIKSAAATGIVLAGWRPTLGRGGVLQKTNVASVGVGGMGASDLGQIAAHPEVAMVALDAVERKFAPPSDIFHIIERYTSCGVGICGKCATPSGHRSCIDGPAFSAEDFTPGLYERDLTGKKHYLAPS